MSKVGSIIEQIRGVSYKPEDVHDKLTEDSVILLRANNIKDGMLNFDDIVFVDRKKVSAVQYLKAGDILVCASSGSKELVGKATHIEQDMDTTFGAFCKVVRPKIECTSYLGHYFQSPIYRKQISALSAGVNINNIRNEHIDSLEIPLPHLETQKQIAATLDKVTDLINKRKQQLEKLDELVKSRFIEMFGIVTENPYGFQMATLKEVCHKITDGKHGGCEQEADSGYYYVGAREIHDDCIHYDTAPQITCADFFKDYKRCNIERGDMVIVNTGATIGKTAIATSPLTERTLLQKSVALLKVKTEIICAEFLRHCYIVNPSMYKVESASAQPNLLLSRMNVTRIYLPPIELQQQFVAFVSQTDKSKQQIQQSLEKLETLKKSLMQEYFG